MNGGSTSQTTGQKKKWLEKIINFEETLFFSCDDK
jgi:hypothetical protein